MLVVLGGDLGSAAHKRAVKHRQQRFPIGGVLLDDRPFALRQQPGFVGNRCRNDGFPNVVKHRGTGNQRSRLRRIPQLPHHQPGIRSNPLQMRPIVTAGFLGIGCQLREHRLLTLHRRHPRHKCSQRHRGAAIYRRHNTGKKRFQRIPEVFKMEQHGAPIRLREQKIKIGLGKYVQLAAVGAPAFDGNSTDIPLQMAAI